MTSKDYVQRLDWSSAIAAATLELDPNSSQVVKKEESYLYRGIAYCFISSKEGKHKEAIDDLSKAIIYYKNILGPNIKEAYYYRAYAYYLDGDYERAIADCWQINDSLPRDELLGKIYLAMNNYHEAVRRFSRAIRKNKRGQNPPISTPSLLHSYQEACKRMNSV